MAKLVVFASGNGSNFEALVEAVRSGYLDCEISHLIVDKKGAGAIARAQRLSIDYSVVVASEYSSKEEYEQEIIKIIGNDVDLIVLAGYMRLVGKVLLSSYQNKIINIHPSLLPKYKGLHAFERSYESDDLLVGATVHYVNEDLDGGDIIDQVSFEKEGLTLVEAEDQLHQHEHSLYKRVIKKLLEEKNEKGFS